MSMNTEHKRNNVPYSDFRLWLQSEFLSRSKKNPRYSIRSFARFLEMDSSTVSQLLSGSRKTSKKLALRICEKLNPNPKQFGTLLESFEEVSETVDYHQISMDAFSVIADWHHYAILELTYTDGFSSDAAWISKKLGISLVETRAAIERLLRLELLEIKNGKLRKTKLFTTNFSNGITGPALKEMQRQVLQKALAAIDETPQSEKDITAMTMAINEDKLPAARELIKKFRRDLCQFLEKGKRTKVYNLAIQLYPISKSSKESS